MKQYGSVKIEDVAHNMPLYVAIKISVESPARLCFGLHATGSRSQQCKVVAIGRHVCVGDSSVRHEVVEEGWGNDGSLSDPPDAPPAPGREAKGVVGRHKMPSYRCIYSYYFNFKSVQDILIIFFDTHVV